jgi:hypothetical protein
MPSMSDYLRGDVPIKKRYSHAAREQIKEVQDLFNEEV